MIFSSVLLPAPLQPMMPLFAPGDLKRHVAQAPMLFIVGAAVRKKGLLQAIGGRA